MTRTVLWDVDTQIDFVLPAGKLYVPGSETVTGEMARLVEAARARGVPHVASADDHELTDDEISAEPDWESTFPPHCLRGTRGAERVPETKQVDPIPLASSPVPERWFRGREFLILKNNFDPFSNPNADRLLAWLDPEEVVVFGIATDICDDVAIRGLLARGRRVAFVEDAARALDETRATDCLAAWRSSGVRFTTVDEVVLTL